MFTAAVRLWAAVVGPRARRPTAVRRRPRVEPLEGRALLAAGGPDLGFGNRGAVVVGFDRGPLRFDEATDVAVQADGKVVAVGGVERAEGNRRDFGIVRLRKDGSPDRSFGDGGRVVVPFDRGGLDDDAATSVAIQKDGKIVVAGISEHAEGDYDFAVIRLNRDGSLDRSFGRRGKAIVAFNRGALDQDFAYGVAIQKDGKIVLVGSAEVGSGNTDFAVARLNRDGSLDRRFGSGGKRLIPFERGAINMDRASDIAVQPDGKIVLAGSVEVGSGNFDFGAVRLTRDGALDRRFGDGGKLTIAFERGGTNQDLANDVALQADGKILLAGVSERFGSSNYDFAVARLNRNGSLDRSFGDRGGAVVPFENGGTNNDYLHGVAVQRDGKILLAGAVEMGGADFDFGIVRLNKDGTPDRRFGGRGKLTIRFNIGGSYIDRAAAIAVQRDGRIVAAGYVQIVGANFDFAVVRMLPR